MSSTSPPSLPTGSPTIADGPHGATKIPKYYRVKSEILALMEDLRPGDAVPTERRLAERLDTSRTTVRKAIAELVVDGRLERTQGSGTYVAQPKLMQVRQLTSFSHDLSQEGWRPGSVLLSIDELPADGDLCQRLQVPAGTPIVRVERLRTAEDEPIAHELAHVPGPLPGLEESLAEHGSLYQALALDHGVTIQRVEDTVETSLASPGQAQLLHVETGLPMLLIHRTAWDENDRPVEWTRSVFRGDRFRFVARQSVARDT